MADDSKIHRIIDLATATYARELEGQVIWHPPADELIAYQEARIGPDRASVVRTHLVECRLCAEELTLLDSYDEENGPADELEEPNLASSWRRFLTRVATASVVAFDKAPSEGDPSRGASRPVWPSWILAASALLALGGIVALALALGRPAGTGGAERTAYVLDLLPEGGQVLRSTEDVEAEEIPPAVDTLVLRLHLGDLTEHPQYSATIITTGGDTVWQQTNLHRQPAGGFALVIPRGAIAAGDYQLHLRGVHADGERPIAVYRFRLRDVT